MLKLLRKYEPEVYQNLLLKIKVEFFCWKEGCNFIGRTLEELMAHLQMHHPTQWQKILELMDTDEDDHLIEGDFEEEEEVLAGLQEDKGMSDMEGDEPDLGGDGFEQI